MLLATTSFAQIDCSPADFIKLKDKKLQDSFFKQLDSIRKVQYPKNDQDTKNSVDITRKMLKQLLKSMDTETLKKNDTYVKYYFFNIHPRQYADTKACKDRITVQYFSKSCTYRVLVDNVYLVDRDCIGGSQVSYGFKIIGDKIIDFSRDEAG